MTWSDASRPPKESSCRTLPTRGPGRAVAAVGDPQLLYVEDSTTLDCLRSTLSPSPRGGEGGTSRSLQAPSCHTTHPQGGLLSATVSGEPGLSPRPLHRHARGTLTQSPREQEQTTTPLGGPMWSRSLPVPDPHAYRLLCPRTCCCEPRVLPPGEQALRPHCHHLGIYRENRRPNGFLF